MTYADYQAQARSRAATMRQPGCYVYPSDMPPVTKRAANGLDEVIDVEATKAKYGLN